MAAAEESVAAWRLSSIGLTPESSGTSQGHRAIFMAHHAPWMYRIGYEAKDQFLIDVARSAIVGRYSNFPGYHINTARTTIYEKPDYPLRPFKELSVNSFHFNHIWPLASVLTDYLVTDAYVRSKGAIDFPSEFIEGYAYLQSKFYGHRVGAFYGEEAWLWMPQKVLEVSSDEINFLTARGENTFFVAFSNQSDESIDFTFQLSRELTGYAKVNSVRIRNNNEEVTKGKLEDGSMQLRISPNGVVAIAVDDIQIKPKFQQQVTQREKESVEALSLIEIKDPKAKAMILDLGQGLKTAYIYLEDDDEVFSRVTLNYSVDGGRKVSLEDAAYPFEFTIPLETRSKFGFSLEGKKTDGSYSKSENIELGP
jgi:hypothetical protein